MLDTDYPGAATVGRERSEWTDSELQYRVIVNPQALSILGHRRDGSVTPYGTGGGGLLKWFGLGGPDVVVISLLAKAFGASLAALVGEKTLVNRIEATGDTRAHSSQPSSADVAAGEHALGVNTRHGNALRRRLADLIRRFRTGLKRIGLLPAGGCFPVQALSHREGVNPVALYRRLKRTGLRTVLLREDPSHEIQLAFLINAGHRTKQIDFAIEANARCLTRGVTRDRTEVQRVVSM